LRLIDDVLDLSRIESGTMSISIEPVDLERMSRRGACDLSRSPAQRAPPRVRAR
jgi:signal transduction histidine kinase